MNRHQPFLDDELAFLVAQLELADINEITAMRSDESSEQLATTGEDFAFQLQADNHRRVLQHYDDHRIASSLHSALTTDIALINALSKRDLGAIDDHRAAQALSQGLPLPAPTDHQRSLQTMAFPPPAPPRPPVPSPSIKQETKAPVKSNPFRPPFAPTNSAMSIALNPPSRPPSYTSTPTSPRTQTPSRFVDCIICGDKITSATAFQPPCRHYYCRSCIVDLVETATLDETLFPLRCCQKEFAVEICAQYLPRAILSAFQKKAIEYRVPNDKRLYCPTSTCSRFLGSTDAGQRIICTTCYIVVCTQCTRPAHPGKSCVVDESTEKLKALARAEQWQTCPGCKTIVELQHGCFHMTCRCRVQFCYLCAERWKHCSCPQWDENRLVAAAAARVEEEHGPAPAPAPAPAPFGGLFAQPAQNNWNHWLTDAMEDLRENHGCDQHRWTYSHGGGACSECAHNLPIFLLRCTKCRIRVCKRCSLNRF